MLVQLQIVITLLVDWRNIAYKEKEQIIHLYIAIYIVMPYLDYCIHDWGYRIISYGEYLRF